MHFYYLFFLLIYISLPWKSSPKIVEIKCPEQCKCDFFKKLKRVTCMNRNLVNIELNIPQQTQILDLSFNQISSINQQVFMDEDLLSLQLLNVSHNKIGHVHMNAFKGLTQLKTLDLSYNGMRYILKNWFWSLESLEELYLRGNSFSKIDNEPLFMSNTVKRLDLSNCRISYIGDDALSQIPKLEYLDVSENFLIHLTATTIYPLQNLKILKVENNTFSCDGVTQNLSDYCIKKEIKFENPCKPKVLKIEKFQRMQMLEEPEDDKNTWLYNDDETSQEKNENTTKIIEVCNNTVSEKKNLLQEIVDLSPILSITIPFIYGILVGALMGYIIYTFAERKKDLNGSTYMSFDEGYSHFYRRRNTSSRRSLRYSRALGGEERENLPLREYKLSESTPVLFRKNTS